MSLYILHILKYHSGKQIHLVTLLRQSQQTTRWLNWRETALWQINT